MADPFEIFRNGSDSRRNSLKMIWPELHAALLPPPTDRRVDTPCAMTHPAGAPVPPVAGRMWLNGTPACTEHLKQASPPGGYPLDLVDPREWKRRS